MKFESTESKLWTTNQVVFATLFVVCVFLSFWLLFRFRVVVFLFFIAIVIGTTIRPAVEWLYQRGLSRPLGIIIIYFLITGFLVGFIALVVPLVVDQATLLYQDLPEYQVDFRSALLESNNLFLQNIGRSIPFNFIFPDRSNPTPEEVIDQVNQTLYYTNMVMNAILSILAVLLLAYYWTQESNFVIRNLLSLVPRSRRKELREFVQITEVKIGGYVRGQGILSLVVGLAAFIAYALIGLPYALVLAIFAGIMEMVPIFGPALGAIPAILVSLSVDPGKAVWVLIATAVIQLVENVWLVPRIMKNSMGVNPIIVLLSLIAFSSVFGFPGALLALPLAAIIQLFFERLVSAASENGDEIRPDWIDLETLREKGQATAQAIKDTLYAENSPPHKLSDPVRTELKSISQELNDILGKLDSKN